jgi:DNA modification methylase
MKSEATRHKLAFEQVRLVRGDSRLMTELCPELLGQVALVVTSPPYHNAISYESHAVNPSVNYRHRTALDYGLEYLPTLNRVWDESWKLLRPGGYLAINTGTVLHNGEHFPLPQDIASQILESELKWKFVKNIIWHKVTAGVKRAGSVIQHRLPGYWYPNIMTEHILIARKPGRRGLRNLDVPQEWWEDVWDIAPVPPKTVEHPAPFPEDLPHRLIRMFTRHHDCVLDPFNGAGATTKAAIDLGRRAVGFDLESKYIAVAERRIKSDSAVRPLQLRIAPVRESSFIPGKSRGKTRHGSGLSTRTRDE